MGNVVAQNASAQIICGPFMTPAGALVADLTIANNQIVLVKENGASVARSDAVSATSAGPGLQLINLNATDTNTLGTITIWVSASAMLPYAKQVEVWNSVTWNAFYGSDPLLGSAATSVLIQGAFVNYDIPTSADISAIVTVVVKNVLTNMDIVTSAGVSAIVTVVAKNVLTNMDIATSTGISAAISIVGSAVAGRALTNYQAPTSATMSTIMVGVLTNYDVPTSADISAIVSAVVSNVITLYDVPTSADISAIVSAVVSGVINTYNVASVGDIVGGGVDYASISGLITQALTQYQVMTSAGTSALISVVVNNALTLYDVPTSADISAIGKLNADYVIASVSSRVIVALSQWEVPSSANMSIIVAGALANYDVASSADVSSIVANAAVGSAAMSVLVAGAVWNRAAAEPTTAPDWGSVSRGTGFDWLLARSLNRHSQTTGTIEIYASAGSVIASASVSNNSVSATRDQFRG